MGQEISYEGSTDFTITTSIGVFKGITFRDPKTGEALCHRFAGIRYALPLTKRWTRPQLIPDDYDYSAKEYKDFSPICPQPKISGKLALINPHDPTDDDCAYLNIWVPATLDLSKPDLPVLFFIHGGWMQYGNANQAPSYDPRTLQSAFDKNFIIVAPAYRLNSIGFLHTKHLADDGISNLGFWDQRLALEWTSKFIKNFGGDSDKITVAGLSAGSYSTFFQLAYEVYHPKEKQIIKQVCLFSNCLIVQPKYLEEVEDQFEEYVEILGIDSNLSAFDKIEALRKIDSDTLMEAIPKMKMHTFRAITDDSFVSSTLLADMYSGDYGLRLHEKGVRILLGEVDNEPEMYSFLNTPKTKEDLALQLENYYPKATIQTLVDIYDNSSNDEELRIVFGKSLADSQIYASLRGFLHNSLKKSSELESKIFRYRISFVPQFMRQLLDSNNITGVIHSNDMLTWFFPFAENLSEQEKAIIKNWLEPYIDFIHLKDIEWGPEKITQFRYLNDKGEVSVEEDPFWEQNLDVSEKIYRAQL